MKANKSPVVENKSVEELQEAYDELEFVIEQYLFVLGADAIMVKDIIKDLKSQMFIHADANVNAMIADLIELENKIKKAKEEEKQLQPQ